VRLIVLGPQGAGKGTQGKRIADKFGIVSIATGDIFRWAISSGTDLGQKVKQYVESGRLVPNDLTIEVVRERLAADDAANGFLIDGFPRTIEQAAALDEILEARGVSLDAALVLEVPEDVSLRRITGRRVCINCGRNYHVDSPPERDWTCDTCGGEVGRRFDDEGEEMVRERLRLYHEQTEPLKQHYAERGLLRAVDGEGGVNEVFDRIVALL